MFMTNICECTCTQACTHATCMNDIFLTASTLISTQLGRIKVERAIDQVNMVKGICLGDVHSWGPYEDKHTIEDLLFLGHVKTMLKYLAQHYLKISQSSQVFKFESIQPKAHYHFSIFWGIGLWCDCFLGQCLSAIFGPCLAWILSILRKWAGRPKKRSEP